MDTGRTIELSGDAALQFRHAELAAFFAYWQEKRGRRRMPARADLLPHELRRHLPFMMLTDVLRDDSRLRFRCRLVGTEICRAAGRDATGRYWDDLVPPAEYETVTQSLRTVAASGEPRRLTGRLWQPSREWMGFESVDLPLSDDGSTVNMIVTRAAYDRAYPR